MLILLNLLKIEMGSEFLIGHIRERVDGLLECDSFLAVVFNDSFNAFSKCDLSMIK